MIDVLPIGLSFATSCCLHLRLSVSVLYAVSWVRHAAGADRDGSVLLKCLQAERLVEPLTGGPAHRAEQALLRCLIGQTLARTRRPERRPRQPCLRRTASEGRTELLCRLLALSERLLTSQYGCMERCR